MILIKHRFTTLNEYTNISRANKYSSAKIKKVETNIAYYHFRGIKIDTPCKFKFTWYVKNKRTDPDNIAFSKKFILDGCVNAGAIPNDSLKYITGFEDRFELAEFYGVKIEWEVE